MEIPIITPDISLVKSIELYNEGKKYICEIKIVEDLIQTNIYLDKILKYKGNIYLEKIQSQIKTFLDYNLYEIFDEIYQLEPNNFSIIKISKKYKLNIEFLILRKKKNIIIDLNEKVNDDIINDLINNYENIIKEKDNIISELKEKIKNLEEKLNIKENEIKQDKNFYNNFNINKMNPIHKLNSHKDYVYCMAVLNDGRLVSGSCDKSIIIYNKITYQPDLIIKEHNDLVYNIIQLNSGILASCSGDKTIKLFNIKGNNYEILQTLDYHSNCVYKIIELKNKYLVSCSQDQSLIFYFEDNDKYQKDYQITTKGDCNSVVQTKENEICFSEYNNNNYNICFFDLNERKIKASISNISIGSSRSSFNMISNDLLIIGGCNKMSIVNINQYKLIKTIEVSNSTIYGFCMLNENMFLTGDNNGIIRQWKIEGDNIILFSKKEKVHDSSIYVIVNIGGGHIASGSSDKSIKIW